MAIPVTVYILAYQDEANLRQVLPTVAWADEVLVVDSFSTDGTAQLCQKLGVRHVNVPFHGFGQLRNEALELASHQWVVSIDSDERSTPEFAAEVGQTLAAPRHAAYFVPRRNFFLGRPIRYCGMYPDYRQPQVFDRRKLRYRDDLVHEGFDCDGSVGYFQNAIVQHPFPTLAVVMAKNERYTTLMAQRYYKDGRRSGIGKLVLSPLAGFLKKYFLQQGFREGMHGFLIAGLHAYYTFVKYAKLWELQQQPPSKNVEHATT
jgi:glycosyltransferase involved in cell wall biosynthesis